MATSSPVFVPREEYLQTTYHPDRDWINGETKERSFGEQPHASVQGFFTQLFRNNRELWGVRAVPELRSGASLGGAQRRRNQSLRSCSRDIRRTR